MIEAQVLVEIVRDQILFRQSAPFMKVLITLQKNVSKELDMKGKKPAHLVLWTTDKRNGHLETVLDVDLNIT